MSLHPTRHSPLLGKVVLITGASSGIGAATALACGAAGMRVALAARRQDRLEALAADIALAGGEAFPVSADTTDPEQIHALVAAVETHYGRIDVLVANAGIGCPFSVTEIEDEQLTRLVEVNLLGTLRCARAVLPGMLARGSGHIITVSSVVIGLIWPNDALYAATRAGVHRFSAGLRAELRPRGITVTDVVPGVIDTPLAEGVRGIPKASASTVAQAIVREIQRPRRAVVITPGWYRPLMLLNRALPGSVDRLIARLSAVKH